MILLGKHTSGDLANCELDPKSCRSAGRREKPAEGGRGGRGVVKEGSSAWPARMGRNSPWEKSRDMKKSETKVQAGEVSWPGPQPLWVVLVRALALWEQLPAAATAVVGAGYPRGARCLVEL